MALIEGDAMRRPYKKANAVPTCRGEALPRPLLACDGVDRGRRSASPLQTSASEPDVQAGAEQIGAEPRLRLETHQHPLRTSRGLRPRWPRRHRPLTLQP